MEREQLYYKCNYPAPSPPVENAPFVAAALCPAAAPAIQGSLEGTLPLG